MSFQFPARYLIKSRWMSAKTLPDVTTLFNKENTSPVFELALISVHSLKCRSFLERPHQKKKLFLTAFPSPIFAGTVVAKKTRSLSISLRATPTENTGQNVGTFSSSPTLFHPQICLIGRPFSKFNLQPVSVVYVSLLPFVALLVKVEEENR